jgi:hypothetical protein
MAYEAMFATGASSRFKIKATNEGHEGENNTKDEKCHLSEQKCPETKFYNVYTSKKMPLIKLPCAPSLQFQRTKNACSDAWC